jgi:hypothetical protein
MNGDGAHVTVPDAWLGPAERHAAARDAYRRSVDDGAPLSAAALAAQFDRSPRWAQDRIAEVRRQRSTIRPFSSNGTDHAAHGPFVGPPAANRPPVGSTAQRLDTLVVAVVALVAAAASYQHQRTLAALAGEGWLAWALPISVDGMMLATGRSILRRRRAGIAAPVLSWFGLTVGFVASVAANVAAAHPTPVGRLIAAWPPVALFIASRPWPPTTATGRTPDPKGHARAPARYLPRLAYMLVQKGEIPSVQLGRRIVVPRRALEQLLDGPDDAA